MKVHSVERERRAHYLTCGQNPNGDGVLAIISLGSPQRGDADVIVLKTGIFPSAEAAGVWFREQMETRPWERVVDSVPIPEGLGDITGLRAEGGKLIADTTSGVPMIVPIKD